MRIVGNDPTLSRQITATASGAISAAGKPLIVNTDGTVTSTILDSATESLGSEVVFESANPTNYIATTFDSNSNKVVIVYTDGGNSYYGTAIVGTVDSSDNSISFGSPTVIESAYLLNFSVTFDSSNNKVVVAYTHQPSSETGKAIVGTVSGTSISFGTAATFDSNANNSNNSVTFDTSNNKIALFYRDNGNSNYGTGKVGTVSGTDISFGSAAVFESADVNYVKSVFDSSNNKIVVAYQDNGNSNYGTAIVGTISGTSISFGSAVVHESAATNYRDIVFDSTNNKVIISYQNQGSSPAYQLYGVVGTVSSTSISFGTSVSAGANTRAYDQGMAYDAKAQKAVVGFWDHYDSKGRYIPLTVSGTNITWGTGALLNGSNLEYVAATFDSNSNRVVFGFKDHGNSNYGTAVVLQNGFTNELLTTENFIGTSAHAAADGAKVLVNTQGAIDENQSGLTAGQTFFVDKNGDLVLTTNATASVGTESVFESGATELSRAAFDTNSNRILVAYCDDADSDKGKAVVGTVASDGTISYGTPAIFNDAGTREYFGIDVVFDSNVNKFVIFYGDGGSSGGPGRARVATVDSSDNSVTFGTEATFESGNVNYISATFDSSANKIVIAYMDSSNSNNGTAIVGTVSGTDITFGSASLFEGASTAHVSATYDSTNNKTLISFRDVDDSSKGKSRVATVSGTSLSYGTVQTFSSVGITNYINSVFDPDNGKVIITYEENAGVDSKGRAKVATISGTDVSFGSVATFNDASTYDTAPVYDTLNNKVIVVFRDNGNNNYTAAIEGTVSGTSISFGSETVIYSAFGYYPSSTFDSNVNKTVAVYSAGGNVYEGASATYTTAQDLSGSLSHDAVPAGTALSATKLLVKG
jgi:hypothetical protein